jgi:formyl-CoA transferase
MQLADLGADVIKVEPPGGDTSRYMGVRKGDDSTGFAAVNRGKRSIVLDLKNPNGRAALVRLAETADIFIESSRPGAMIGLGLGYDVLSGVNPRLIYASISGYGQTGPDSAKGGLDLIAQGVSGLMSVTGEPGRPPVKAGVPVTDLGAGLFALAGILAALHHRHSSGKGQYIDTSLIEAGLALSVWESADYFGTGAAPQAMGSAHRFLAPYQAIRCADGYITVGAGTDRLFAALCDALGHPEWATEADFGDAASRVRNRSRLAAAIEGVTTNAARADLIALFESRGIPCGPINSYAEALSSPQATAREMVVTMDHPALGQTKVVGSPLKMSATPASVGRRAPQLGEHTVEVLREAGFTDAEIQTAQS